MPRAGCRTRASAQVLQEIGHPKKAAHANGMFEEEGAHEQYQCTRSEVIHGEQSNH